MTIKGKKKSYSQAPQTSLYFLSLQSGPLLQVSTRQVSHLPSDPNHCNTKSPLSEGLHKASHLPFLTILMHLRYCSQVHLSNSMTLITKLPDSVIQWYSQCLQNKVQKSLSLTVEVLMEENKALAHLPNVL